MFLFSPTTPGNAPAAPTKALSILYFWAAKCLIVQRIVFAMPGERATQDTRLHTHHLAARHLFLPYHPGRVSFTAAGIDAVLYFIIQNTSKIKRKSCHSIFISVHYWQMLYMSQKTNKQTKRKLDAVDRGLQVLKNGKGVVKEENQFINCR